VFQADAGVVFADAAVRCYQNIASEAGAALMPNTTVSEIDRSSHPIKIRTSLGAQFHATKVVISSGAWTNKSLGIAGFKSLPIVVQNEQASYFSPVPSANKIDVTISSMPVWIKYGSPSYYGIPQIPGGIPGAKVAGHQVGPVVDSNSRSYDVEPKLLSAVVEDLLSTTFPCFNREPVDVVRCLYSMTPDYHFILDKHPEDERFVVAGGFCGAGFKHAPIVGQLIFELLTEKRLSVDITQLSIRRFANSKL